MVKPSEVLTAMLVALGCAILVGVASCTQKQVKSALDASQTVCVLLHADAEPKDIAVLCAIDEVAVPTIEQILSAHREAMRRESAKPAASASGSAPPAPPPAPSAAPSPAPAAAASAAPAAPPPAVSASAAPAPSASAPKPKRKSPK